jgi:outer membrane lipoprotein SlyB
MKNLFAALILALCSAAAFAQFDFDNSRAPDKHSRSEGLQTGKAYLCKVIQTRNTTIETAPTTQLFGGAVGGLIGAAVVSRNSHNATAQILGGLLGSSAGVKVSQAVANDSAQSIVLQCPGSDNLITVVQQDTLKLSKGQDAILEQINGRSRVSPI